MNTMQMQMMKQASLCLCLFAATLAAGQAKTGVTTPGQAKKGTPISSAASVAAKICAEPYAASETEATDGWPESPVYILFHHADSKAPWAHNPAIRVPGLEAATPAAAHTIVCVEESRIEMGHYDSGEPGYVPAWTPILVRASDRKVYFMGRSIDGEMPPEMKYKKGAGVGKPPTELFTRWLRLMVEQKVARRKLRLKTKEYHEVSAMAFSADGSRLAVAQEPRSTANGTPPSPITVFDLATGQPIAAMHADYSTRAIAISKSGSTLATERYGHVELWDVAAAKVARKLETSNVSSLVFGPDDTLGMAGNGNAVLWDVSGNRALRSGAGSLLELSPEGAWLVMEKGPKSSTVRELESGREVGTFPCFGDQYKCIPARDGKMMVQSSLLSATVYLSGAPKPSYLSLPDLGVSTLCPPAATSDGFVIANGDGFAGIVSAAAPEPRTFATDLIGIRNIAVSRDGKLVALGDNSGSVEIWELR